ncbi:MAG: LLM class F420-dependent oxidoreductase [Acidimicrobiales bacterium]
MHDRRFRFGLSVGSAASRSAWHDLARRTESAGFDVLLAADHLVDDAYPPLPALLSAAEATEALHVGTYVLNNDFRHPVVLAREAVALGALTEGRFELGIGAGHMKSEYDQAGIAFDRAGVRVDRLEESVAIIKGLLAGEEVSFEGRHHQVQRHRAWPVPIEGTTVPLLVGGNGHRVLALAARHADAVGFVGFAHNHDATEVHLSHFTAAGLDAQVAWVRDQAGDRFDRLELSLLVQRVDITGDRRAAAVRVKAHMPALSVDDVLDSPYVLLGTPAQIADQLRERRERFGVTHWVTFGERPGSDQRVETMAPVIELLR